MLLRSESSARLHRSTKRHREIIKILAEIERPLEGRGLKKWQEFKILEFGCGNGFQIPYLEQLGTVFATDIYSSDEITKLENLAFCESDITQLPFPDNSFDMIFSNHVVEHLPHPEKAFKELKRTATKECVFVFSVPTNIWLLLSLPAKYLGKLTAFWYIVAAQRGKSKLAISNQQNDVKKRMEMEQRFSGERSEKITLKEAILPRGHGVYPQFRECYKAFKTAAWTQFFRQSDFEIQSMVPLMLYGPSERPLVPTSSWLGKYGICSSVLFIMSVKES